MSKKQITETKSKSKSKQKQDKYTTVSGEVGGGKTAKTAVVEEPGMQYAKMLSQLQKETTNLKKKLIDRTNEYNMIKGQKLSALSKINKETENAEAQMKVLLKENNFYLENFKQIQNEVDIKMKVMKLFVMKEQELQKKVESLQKEINIKEKEIEISKRNIEIYKKERDKIESLYETNVTNDAYSSLLDKKEELENKITSLQSEIKVLKSITNAHMKCESQRNRTQLKLDQLKNEYDFQTKKQTLPEIPVSHSTIIKQPSTISNNRYYKQGEINENKGYKKAKFLSSLKPLWNELNSVNELYKQKAVLTAATSSLNRTNLETDVIQNEDLFRPEEKELLIKLIPEEHINTYQDKFDEMKNNHFELEEKFRNERKEKQKVIKEHKEKIDYYILKNKSMQKTNLKLSAKVPLLKQQIGEKIKSERLLNKNLQQHLDVYIKKIKEHEKLQNHLNKLLDMIKNGILVKKQQEKDDTLNFDDEEEEEEDDNEEEEKHFFSGDEQEDNNDEQLDNDNNEDDD